MIYPLLPIFLTQNLGAGPVAIGIIEGAADAFSSFLKIIAGIWTDKVGKRKPFILIGYIIAAISRPLIALANSWYFVLGLRITDRVGKGIRTSPRDALIADLTSQELRGTAYGIHRSMDHAGAFIGPLIASVLMGYLGFTLNKIFLFAAIPATIGVFILLFGIREPKRIEEGSDKISLNIKEDWSLFNNYFKVFLLSVFIFTLGNSTDAFLLLKLSQTGISISWIPFLWAILHVIKMLSTYFCGKFADHFGKNNMIISGWIYFSLIYLGFALTDSLIPSITLFLLYGLFFGMVEPSERALVADLVPAKTRGTAFGFFHGVVGLSALPSSVIFGWIWQTFGAPAAFTTGSLLAILACFILLYARKKK